MSSFVVASTGEWNFQDFSKLSKKIEGEWHFASDPGSLNNILKTEDPAYIFFPHWNWVVPHEIVERYECICFHMTDLPYGRGGSPLQNLIVRGHENTILTALRMDNGIDTGPIYYKKPLSLQGSAYDIYKRAGKLCWSMIIDFINENPDPKPQKGQVTNFKRRTPEQSRIPRDLSSKGLYNYIRMLDAPGYPSAFLEVGGYRLEFKDASYINGELNAKVSFRKKDT